MILTSSITDAVKIMISRRHSYLSSPSLLSTSIPIYRFYQIENETLNQKKITLRYNTNTSEIHERQYYEEYQTFASYFFSQKFVTLLLLSTIGPTMSEIVIEVEKFENNRRRNDNTEFDIHGAIDRKIPIMQYRALSCCATQAIRKCYEYIALLKLSPRIVDKLTKDVVKSSLRKLQRISYFNVGIPIFSTALYCYSISCLSQWTWEVPVVIWENNRKGRSVRKTSLTILKKSVMSLSRWIAMAAGFSIGSLIGPSEWTLFLSSSVGSLVADIAVTALLEPYLGDDK